MVLDKIEATVTLRLNDGDKVITKEFPTYKDAEEWIKKMSKNKAFISAYSPTLGVGIV